MNNSSVQNLDSNTESFDRGKDKHQSLLDSEKDGEKLNLDQALTKVGGFGTFQTLLLTGMTLLKNAGGPVLYLYSYLTLPQKYECKLEADADWTECDAATFICPAQERGEHVEYRVDTSYEYYLENWQQQMGLMCMEASKIALSNVFFFVFFGVAGFCFFPVMDKIGRRKSHWIFSTGHILSQTLILFVPNYTARVVGFSMQGFMMVKNSLCYTWTFEFLLKDHKARGSSVVNILEFTTCIFAGVYFLLIGTSVMPLLYFFYAYSLLGYLLVSFVVPESPKWLMLQGRREEAIEVLNYVAWFNRSKTTISPNAQFVECAVAEIIENQQNQSRNVVDRSIFHEISQLSIRATQLASARVQGLSAPKKKSFVGSLITLTLLMSFLQTQYFMIYHLATSIGGNKFINCILIGVGELLACIISATMMSHMSDTLVFKIMAFLGCASNLIFYAVPEGILQYLCFIGYVFGAAGQFNCIYPLIELRIPPENSASAIVITTCIGVLSAGCAPMLGSLGHPYTMIIPSFLAASNFALSFCLVAPGTYLPQAVKLSLNVTLLKVDNVNQAINESIMNPVAGFGASFDLTYFEKIYGMQRPRLNETNIDPDMIRDGTFGGDHSGSIGVVGSDSMIARNWAWDISLNNINQHYISESQDQSFIKRYKISDNSLLYPILENES